MKRVLSPALAALLLVSSATASARAADKPTGDAAKFQGVWRGMGGPSGNVPFTIAFEGAKAVLAVEIQGEERKFEGEFKLDEKAGPKRIDWVKFTNAGEAVPDNLGIYKLDGDKLVVCSGGPGKDRPTEFKAGDEGSPTLSELVRVSDDKDKEKKDEIKGDLAKFQGKWKTKLGQLDIDLEIVKNKATAKFTGDDGQENKLEGEIVVNDAAKPKAIDFVKFHRQNGDDMGDNLGIYTIEDDKITICLGGPGNDRPTEFKAGDGGAPTLITLEKAKN